MAETLITPSHLFPAISEDGTPKAVERVFEVTSITDEQASDLIPYAMRFADLIHSLGPFETAKEAIDENWPWLGSWARSIDSWVAENGLHMPIPIAEPSAVWLIPQVDRPTPDHMDTFKHMPIGLSIGMQGARELVGVALDSAEECFEAQQKLKKDRQQLWKLDEFEGKEVQRAQQKFGDVVHIGGFATLHSGRPVESPDGLINAALTVGVENTVAEGYEKLAEEHLERFYTTADDMPGAMGFSSSA